MEKPYYEHAGITIYHGDCREILPHLEKVDLVLTDPPYPNGAGHFVDGIKTAEWALLNLPCDHAFVFWDEISRPVCSLPLVAIHIWHRTNTNRPDNYEPIFEFNNDGVKRSSRVMPHAVIYPGLTGCHEAVGHPTQKNTKLITELLTRTDAQTILDPFMGSGTTLVAAKLLNRKAIGIELEEKYCEIAAKRLAQDNLFYDGSE